MRNRKGQAEAVVFWIFYLILTGAVIYFIVSTPGRVFSKTTDTQQLENAIFAERIDEKIGWQSPLTQRVYPGVLPTMDAWNKQRIADAFTTVGTPRRLAMKLTLDNAVSYFDEYNYREWKPLSPVRYKTFLEVRPVLIEDQGKLASLTIDQVYARVPPGGVS